MKTKVSEPASIEPVAGASYVARAIAAWNRFWFTPADPIVLGLIRIFCGLVTAYTFVAYTFDMQALLGPHALMDLQTRKEYYRDGPVHKPGLDWQGHLHYPRPQEAGPLQKYWDAYFDKWKSPPPVPWPRDAAEAARIEEYRALWGVDPRTLADKGHPVWSVWFHVTDPDAMMAVQIFFVVVSVLFVLGFCTRVTSALTWFAALCYIHRAAASLFGVDTMMCILLLYLMIGPSGAALSVDRLIGRWWARARPRVLARWHAFWGKGQGTAAVAPSEAAYPERPAPSVSANVAMRLLQVHVCIIYLSAGLAKLQGPAWWNGNAVWGTIANFEFAPMQYDWYLGALRFLARHRWLYELLMTSAGIFTLAFEICYAFLVWRPATRWVILGMAVTLHGFIGIFMGLKTFSLMMLAMNLAFVPPETVHRFVRWLTRGRAGKPAADESARAADAPLKAATPRPEKESRPVAGVPGKRRG